MPLKLCFRGEDRVKTFFIVTVTLLLMIGIYGLSRPNADLAGNGSLQNKVDYVDEKIGELITSDLYREGSLEKREELSSTMLSQLKEEGYIVNLSYSKTDRLFSFQYADGTLGGIKIEDFSSNSDALPMN